MTSRPELPLMTSQPLILTTKPPLFYLHLLEMLAPPPPLLQQPLPQPLPQLQQQLHISHPHPLQLFLKNPNSPPSQLTQVYLPESESSSVVSPWDSSLLLSEENRAKLTKPRRTKKFGLIEDYHFPHSNTYLSVYRVED